MQQGNPSNHGERPKDYLLIHLWSISRLAQLLLLFATTNVLKERLLVLLLKTTIRRVIKRICIYNATVILCHSLIKSPLLWRKNILYPFQVGAKDSVWDAATSSKAMLLLPFLWNILDEHCLNTGVRNGFFMYMYICMYIAFFELSLESVTTKYFNVYP